MVPVGHGSQRRGPILLGTVPALPKVREEKDAIHAAGSRRSLLSVPVVRLCLAHEWDHWGAVGAETRRGSV